MLKVNYLLSSMSIFILIGASGSLRSPGPGFALCAMCSC